eukprot:jgi/Mesvir1/1608/Mv14571-RA.1
MHPADHGPRNAYRKARGPPGRCSLVKTHLLIATVLVILCKNAKGDTCPCQVCPCYCPCLDFKTVRVAVAIDYPVNAPGARQAAVDRNLQLSIFSPWETDRPFQVAEAHEFVMAAIEDGVDAIVTTLLYGDILPALQAARDAGVSLYIVGGSSPTLLASLRADQPTPLDRLLSQGPTVAALGTDEAATASQLAARLQQAGVRHLACLRTPDGNSLYADRCDLLASAFTSMNLTARVYQPLSVYVQVMLVLADMQDSVLAHGEGMGLRIEETAFVVNEPSMYRLLREVVVSMGSPLAAARVAVYQPSPDVFEDVRAGLVPITMVKQGFYSEGYAGVALAAYEMQTGQMLAADVVAPPEFLESGLVTAKEIEVEACRRDGFPVCGAPGVPEVSANGCRCFSREAIRVKVLTTLPRVRETADNFRQGFLDGMRDFPGSSINWTATSDNVISPAYALAAVDAALADANWTALVSLDNFLAMISPPLKAKMKELGASKGDRSFWLGADRDERAPLSAVLSEYKADAYMGPGRATWAALGALARRTLTGSRTQMATGPLHVLPKWDMVSEGFVDGFFERPLLYPDGFWSWPSTPATRALGWVQFYDEGSDSGTGGGGAAVPIRGHVMSEPLVGTGKPVLSGGLMVNRSIHAGGGEDNGTIWADASGYAAANAPTPPVLNGDFAFLHLRQGPLTFDGLDFSVELAKLLGWGFDAMALVPMTSSAVVDALGVLEAQAAAVGRSTKLFSIVCRASSFQAFAYPQSMPGGHRHYACADGQHNLASYITFMAAALHQQTGERPFHGQEISTGRVVTRWEGAGPNDTARRALGSRAKAGLGPGRGATRTAGERQQRRQQRRADCEIFEAQRWRLIGKDGMYFPVCNYDTGCGGAGNPCSGHGVCQFPTAEDNAAAAPELLPPSTGRCVCHPSWEGPLCETQVDRGRSRAAHIAAWVVPWLGGFLLVCVLALVVWRVVQRRRARYLRPVVDKRQPPREGQVAAVVFTDVEGSTTLWEWDARMMSQCIDIHHKVIRTLLTTYYGYESNTEGDAFELVFHDAADALHFMLDVQMHLLYPELLLRSSSGTTLDMHTYTPEGSSRSRQGDQHQAENANNCSSVTGSSSASPPWSPYHRSFDWPAKLLTHELGKEVVAEDGTVLFRGLRVRMGVHVGVPDTSYQHANGRQRYTGPVVYTAKAIGDAPLQGGQLLLSMDTWRAVGAHAMEGLPAFVLHNMGEVVLSRDLPPMQLMEVLPEALLRRAPFPPLRHLAQLSPTFFGAPGSESYVTGDSPSQPLAMMFTFVGGSSPLKSHPDFKDAVSLLVSFVRATLGKHRGYECEEKDGNFLLAFGDPVDAAAFSQEMQAGAMALPWPEELLREEAAAEVLQLKHGGRSAEDAPFVEHFVFRGLRIKCGVYWGVPTKCTPHATTGRAAYFGPIVNRAARVAGTAADGQTLCNAELVEAVKERAGGQYEGLTFTALGKFPLRGLAEPIELYQVSSADTSRRLFPRTRGAKQGVPELVRTESGNSVERILSLAGRPEDEHGPDSASARGGGSRHDRHHLSPGGSGRGVDGSKRRAASSKRLSIDITPGPDQV